MEHMTKATLETICQLLNHVTNNPQETWDMKWKRKDGCTGYVACHKALIGNYHIKYRNQISPDTNVATLRQIIDETGGFTEPFKGDYNTKRELYNLIQAFVQGVDWYQTRHVTQQRKAHG